MDRTRFSPIEDLEHPLLLILSGNRIAQGASQPIEDAGPQQELLHVLRLALQDLLDEVVDDERLFRSKLEDEAVDIVRLERQGGQLVAR